MYPHAEVILETKHKNTNESAKQAKFIVLQSFGWSLQKNFLVTLSYKQSLEMPGYMDVAKLQQASHFVKIVY